MRNVRSTAPIVPSLLDRLIDDDPSNTTDLVKTPSQQMNDIKEAVRRDLENLLNTRLRKNDHLQKYAELKTSLANYGLYDFSQIAIESEDDQYLFAAKIRDIIQRFEPRFKNVQVEVVENGENYHRTLYIKIAAVLLIEPDPIAVVYDSRVQKIDKSLHLREQNHG
ncbi:type VI secretion system baseplate subunit TssE [Halioxenophilus aromaticivorans]|uniref:Type VI secretion system baseplate subunit TssE n=1 Tax=Halioxenophilus aromaticivorans TaxID=1306992 RepID=A0AAV3U2T1_9ALTE